MPELPALGGAAAAAARAERRRGTYPRLLGVLSDVPDQASASGAIFTAESSCNRSPKSCGPAAPTAITMPPRKKSAPAPHAAAVAASKTSQTLKKAKRAIVKSRIAKRDSHVAIEKAEKQESAAKKKIADAKAEQDRVLNEAFAHYRREHVTNGKGPKHSVKWFADTYACSYFRLWRAVQDRRSVAAVCRGRPPKLTQSDLIIANKFIQEADEDDDNFQWTEVVGKLVAIAAG